MNIAEEKITRLLDADHEVPLEVEGAILNNLVQAVISVKDGPQIALVQFDVKALVDHYLESINDERVQQGQPVPEEPDPTMHQPTTKPNF